MDKNVSRWDVSTRLFVLLVILAVFVVGAFISTVVKVVIDFYNMPGNYPREISVSADGKVYAKPDIAKINIGTTSEGLDIKVVVDDNAKKMNAITAKLKTLGVEDRDIQTISYNLYPNYDWPNNVKTLTNYTLDNQIEVKVRDFTKVSEVIAQATTLGANNINNVQFTFENFDKVKEAARAKAIENAKAKAVSLTKQSGLKLGKLVNVWDNDQSGVYYDYKASPAGMGAGGLMESPTVESGEQEIVVNVSLTYKLK